MRGCTPLARLHAVRLNGVSGTYISTPDHADLDIVGDIDLRIALVLPFYQVGGNPGLVSKFALGQRSYAQRITGSEGLVWTVDGSTPFSVFANGAQVVGNGSCLLLAATMDVDDGAGNHVNAFYLRRTAACRAFSDLVRPLSVGWSPYGTPVTTAGTTSIFSGTQRVELGSNDTGTANLLTGKVIAAVIKNGIDGTTVAEFDASRMRVGDTTYTDRFGKVWTLQGTAHIEAA